MQIALLGSAPSSYKLAPFGDMSWEIWACSPMNYTAPRVDAWFEVHNLDRKWVAGNEPYMKALQTHPRVYVAAADYRLPNAIVYPKDEIYKFFGNYQFLDSFFQSQVSYMLAYAIMQKPTTIGLWGIDMAADSEYTLQRPGCHYFFQECEKRGIEVIAPPQSDILEPLPPYGYKEFNPAYWRSKARKQELRQAIDDCRQRIQAAQHELQVKEGAFQNEMYHTNTYLRSPFPPTPREELSELVARAEALENAPWPVIHVASSVQGMTSFVPDAPKKRGRKKKTSIIVPDSTSGAVRIGPDAS